MEQSEPIPTVKRRSLTTCEDFNIWIEIQDYIAHVTNADMDWAAYFLDSPSKGDKVIGKITNPSLIRLWAASIRLAQVSRVTALNAKLAHDQQEQEECSIKALRQDTMSDIIRELAWGVTKDELAQWTGDDVSIRKHWVVVKVQRSDNPFIAMHQLMRGGGE